MSRLWRRSSSPSRKIRTRKPSHFGSKIHSPSDGSSETRLASIGRTVGFTGRFTLLLYRGVGSVEAARFGVLDAHV